MADVLVVGAGPVGLTMAAELARHGVRCRIVDRLTRPLPYCRAIGVTPRTLEVWEDMGIAREMIDAGLWLEGSRSIINDRPAHDARETFPDLPYGHLGVPQYATEGVLARHLAGFGVAVERGVALVGLSQTEDGVVARLEREGGVTEDAAFQYAVGCDGAHSAVRRALGIGFDGDAGPRRLPCSTATTPNGGRSAPRSSPAPARPPRVTGARPAARPTGSPTPSFACRIAARRGCARTRTSLTPPCPRPVTARPMRAG
jgi:2-polyprenyl-6-methoxyphenol hydroxylase-like FAD-dependent oxidoreductase